MNKNELIRKVANITGTTIKESESYYDAFIEAITDSLKNDEKIQLSGFGSFETKVKPAHEGINPSTGEKINIAQSTVPVFKFGKTYKDSFNK